MSYKALADCCLGLAGFLRGVNWDGVLWAALCRRNRVGRGRMEGRGDRGGRGIKDGRDEDEGDEPSPCLLRCLQFTWPIVSVLLD